MHYIINSYSFSEILNKYYELESDIDEMYRNSVRLKRKILSGKAQMCDHRQLEKLDELYILAKHKKDAYLDSLIKMYGTKDDINEMPF